MPQYTITGSDTLTLWDNVFKDFADGDVSAISFPNDLIKIKTGKNQNTIFSRDETGNNCELTLRLLRGSADDRFMRGKLALLEGHMPSIVLAHGQFVKQLGDGLGKFISDVMNLQGGIITKKPEVKENVEGDTVQAVSVYTMKFAIGKSSIQ